MDSFHTPSPSAASAATPNVHSQLSALLQRQPVSTGPDTPVREALQLMSAQQIGSIVIVEPDSGKPLGIFTLRDLLDRVVTKSCDLEQKIASVMSDCRLVMLNLRSTMYQAALLMARHPVHHVIVVDANGRLAGVISQTDLYRLVRGGDKAISGAIRNAGDPDTLVAIATEIRRLTMQMLSDGNTAEAVTQRISALNDQLTVRIIELTQAEFPLPDVPWCWLSFGSEGRFEQTFSTDQDNGLIFAAPVATDAQQAASETQELRAAFLPFARAVNRRLDACGFTLCKGEIMAGNPEWCLSLEEWRGKFSSWLHAAHPQALLNATIFFDFRPLYGADVLADELHDWLLARTAGAALFLRFMAENATRVKPPLGVVREFVYDHDKMHPHTLDLKAFGARIFVDAARIFALTHGVAQTGTAQRLREVAAAMHYSAAEVAAMVDGFYFIQLLRLRHQHEIESCVSAAGAAGEHSATPAAPNRIDPDRLNELDRHILKESFKQARKLQSRLQLDFRL